MTENNVTVSSFKANSDEFFKNSLAEQKRFHLACNRALAKVPEATKEVLYLKALEMYKLGLDIMPESGHLYVVPFRDTVQLMPSVAGFNRLLAKRGFACRSSVVCENDAITITSSTGSINHSFTPFNRGNPIGVYCTLLHKEEYLNSCEFMNWEEIQAIKTDSITKLRDSSRSPWVKFENEMARKTVVKRAIKHCPSLADDDVNKVVSLDNYEYEAEAKAINVPLTDILEVDNNE